MIALRHPDLNRVLDLVRDVQEIEVPDALAGAPVAVGCPRSKVREMLPATIEVVIRKVAGEQRRIHVILAYG